jgi:serine/threonine protein kinase
MASPAFLDASSNVRAGCKTFRNTLFEVKKKLGEGGFGSVYLVHDRAINEVCALKLIRPQLAARKDIQDSFRKEAVIWMEFGRHPNIVNVRAVDHFNGSLFVALESIPPNEFGTRKHRRCGLPGSGSPLAN